VVGVAAARDVAESGFRHFFAGNWSLEALVLWRGKIGRRVKDAATHPAKILDE
jgi:hypothetical protein